MSAFADEEIVAWKQDIHKENNDRSPEPFYVKGLRLFCLLFKGEEIIDSLNNKIQTLERERESLLKLLGECRTILATSHSERLKELKELTSIIKANNPWEPSHEAEWQCVTSELENTDRLLTAIEQASQQPTQDDKQEGK